MSVATAGRNQELFSYAILPSGGRRWRSFGAGFCIELTILAILIWLPLMFPQRMENMRQYLMTHITAPQIDAWQPKPILRPTVRPRPKLVEVAKVEPVEPPKQKIIEPVFEKPVAPKPIAKKIMKAPELNEWAKAMPEANPLANSEAELKKPKAPVQTGGFGDPSGLPKTAKMTQPVNINESGAFDMPTGPGKGNGTGGAKGVVGTTGFGAETATRGERREGSVEAGGFADEKTAVSGPHVQKTADATPDFQPIVLLVKPQGVYTQEARQLKIQGDVIVQAIFKASGTVEVVRVIQGLGHGLDENAETAVRHIQFTPAKQDGHPVDFPATVTVKFELAY